MSDNSKDSDRPKSIKDTWCGGTGSESEVVRHWKKAKNPSKSWQKENRKQMEKQVEE